MAQPIGKALTYHARGLNTSPKCRRRLYGRALNVEMELRWGHFTWFGDGLNYPQRWGTRPEEIVPG